MHMEEHAPKMAEQLSPLTSSDDGNAQSSVYEMRVVLERVNSVGEGSDGINLAELCIFGLGKENVKIFSLSEVLPGRWETVYSIELPPEVAEIKCVIKGEGGRDAGVVRLMLECARPREGLTACEGLGNPIKSLNAQLQLPAVWNSVEICIKAVPDQGQVSVQAQYEHWETLHGRFQSTGNLSDISEAISVLCRIVKLTSEEDRNFATLLNNLGSSFCCRFECTGDLSDIAKAITVQTRAVGLTPDGDAELPPRLTNLGNSFLSRFGHTGDPVDIADAISVQARAVDLTPGGHTDMPMVLNNLGSSLLSRFERTGNLSDAAEGMSVLTQAIHLTPDGHADLPSHLNNLGNSYLSRFKRVGCLADIAEAISAQTQAVRLTPEGHANLPSCLNSLGTSYLSRFKQVGDLADIAEAISAQTQAVNLTPEGHIDLPLWLSNLGNSFLSRFERIGDLYDVGEAIAVQAKAVCLTPEGHADLPSMLMNLGASFMRRFEHTGKLCDIKESIFLQTEGLRLAPPDHATLLSFRANLGASFMRCFELTGNPDDVTEGIYNLGQAAARLTPEMHINLPSILINLGSAWYKYFTSSHHQGHLAAAIFNFKSAATCASGSPRIRFCGAEMWATLSNHHYPSLVDVMTAFQTAIDLLTLIAGLEQTVQHRYTMIEQHGGLPIEAVAVAFRLGQPHTALEWLEQGRCLVWGQQNQLRTPLDKLMACNGTLAERVIIVSQQLDKAGSSRQHSGTEMSLAGRVSLEDEALEHSQLATEWEYLLGEVRKISGFQDFLRPLKCSAILRHLPECGLIVVLNIHEDRCDAIALSAGWEVPLHIPLPNFTLWKVKRYQATFSRELRSHQLRGQREECTVEGGPGRAAGQYQSKARDDSAGVHSVLRGLWDDMSKPILSRLGFLRQDSSSKGTLPRIWWCPTGPLSFLPIHAAGVYQGPKVESVTDYVVSSYTPTVTALAQRVLNDCPINGKVSGLFLTSQPKAPGVGAIPGTTKEVTALHDGAVHNGIRCLKLEGVAVSAKGCPEYMEKFSSIHLACHASQDVSNPMQSRFLFHDGHLTLNTIMQANLKDADLAFLSACGTSTGKETLADEAVHLAAGMLAAGYRRVIATMWAIDDRRAPAVANDFYEYLWARRGERSGTSFDSTLSAYALHHATQRLRESLDSSGGSLLAWIPYVHFGY